MRPVSFVVIAILIAFGVPCPTREATLSNTTIGNWLIGAYSNDQTGQFSHCAAGASYNSGLIMTFAVNRQYGWSLGLGNPEWVLRPNSRYPVAVTVDNIPALNATAVAIAPNQVEVPLADSVALFNAFRRGHTLKIYAAGRTFQFNLTNTSQVLPVLVACVHNHLAPSSVEATNPFEASPTTTLDGQSSASADSAREAEATSLIANILSQAGVSGFRIADVETAKKFNADAAWSADHEVGTVNVIAPDSKLSAEDINAIVIDRDAKACTGKFVSGSMSEDIGRNGLRLFTACASNNRSVTGMYSIIPRGSGGYYVLSIDGEELPGQPSDDSLKNVDSEVRSAAYKVIEKR